MESEFRIERCVGTDCLEDIETLARRIWEAHYTPIIGAAQVAYMLERYQSEVAMKEQMAEGHRYYGVYANDRLVGYIGFRMEGDALFLSKYYIDAAERGKGYGRLCMDFIESCCLEQDCSTIRLTVNKYNQTTIDQYLHMGFRIVDDMVTDIGNGFVMDDHLLEKRLRS